MKKITKYWIKETNEGFHFVKSQGCNFVGYKQVTKKQYNNKLEYCKQLQLIIEK